MSAASSARRACGRAWLGAFHRAHPAVEIILTEQHNDELENALARGDIDAAVIGLTDEPLPPQVRARVIDREPLVLAVRPDHPLAQRASVPFGRLRDCALVTLTRGSGLRTVLDNAGRQAGFTPRIAAETSELGSLVRLAAEGVGVAPLPRSGRRRRRPPHRDCGAHAPAPASAHSPRLERHHDLAAGREFRTIADTHFPDRR